MGLVFGNIFKVGFLNFFKIGLFVAVLGRSLLLLLFFLLLLYVLKDLIKRAGRTPFPFGRWKKQSADELYQQIHQQ